MTTSDWCIAEAIEVETVPSRAIEITSDKDRGLVVNKVFDGDDTVVISFWVAANRDAIGLTPNQARKMAAALLDAANAVR